MMLTRNQQQHSSLLLLYDNNGYMHTSGVHSPFAFVLTHTGGNSVLLSSERESESSNQSLNFFLVLSSLLLSLFVLGSFFRVLEL